MAPQVFSRARTDFPFQFWIHRACCRKLVQLLPTALSQYAMLLHRAGGFSDLPDHDAVTFRLPLTDQIQEQSALAWFVKQLENEIRGKGMAPVGRKVSKLGYGVLS